MSQVVTQDNAFHTAFSNWISSQHENFNRDIGDTILDTALMTYLAPLFAGFMNGPLSMLDNNEIVASSVKFDSWSDLQSFVAAEATTHKLYLYQIIFNPSVFSYIKINQTSFMPEERDEPIMTQQKWLLRYGKIPL